MKEPSGERESRSEFVILEAKVKPSQGASKAPSEISLGARSIGSIGDRKLSFHTELRPRSKELRF